MTVEKWPKSRATCKIALTACFSASTCVNFVRRLHPFRGMIELQNDQIPTKITRMQAMSLKEILSTYWLRIQGELLPWLDDAMDGPLTAHHRQFVSVLGLARIETFLPSWYELVGRPPAERAALARSFIAKAVFNLPTTRLLIDMLSADKTLRRLCGWQRAGEVPSESTFSRAFAEFADGALPSRLHDALVEETHADRLVGHIARDSTAIEAREKPVTSAEPKPPAQPKRKRGRPCKGEERPVEPPRRIERQLGMTLPAMLKDPSSAEFAGDRPGLWAFLLWRCRWPGHQSASGRIGKRCCGRCSRPARPAAIRCACATITAAPW